jgi:hypothetical protein
MRSLEQSIRNAKPTRAGPRWPLMQDKIGD